LQAAALRASLELADSFGMARLHADGVALQCAARAAVELVAGDWVEVLTPGDNARHGAMLSLRTIGVSAAQLEQRLRAQGVVIDVRGEIVRVAFCPLYNGLGDVGAFAAAMQVAR